MNTVKDPKQSYSQALRELFIEGLFERTASMETEFLAAIAACGVLRKDRIHVFTEYPDFATWLSQTGDQLYGVKAVSSKSGSLYWQGDQQEILSAQIENFYLQNPEDLSLPPNLDQVSDDPGTYYQKLEPVQAILRALYVACGSMANPQERYHLEFAVTSKRAIFWFGLFLDCLQFTVASVRRKNREVLYIKEADNLADFLRLTRADSFLLKLEESRVSKDMNNRINRIVNCDSANLQRLANSSARQLKSIQQLQVNPGLDQLPPQLYELALIRLENPELSLQEIGNLLEPPLGKSGVSHRFKRLADLADKYHQ